LTDLGSDVQTSLGQLSHPLPIPEAALRQKSCEGGGGTDAAAGFGRRSRGVVRGSRSGTGNQNHDGGPQDRGRLRPLPSRSGDSSNLRVTSGFSDHFPITMPLIEVEYLRDA
jgi:hypothetical protein